MLHLLARYLEILPLFLAPARPMNDEWKMRPYLGVLPRVFRALRPYQNKPNGYNFFLSIKDAKTFFFPTFCLNALAS